MLIGNKPWRSYVKVLSRAKSSMDIWMTRAKVGYFLVALIRGLTLIRIKA